jgi:hypothetical protein
MWKKFGYFVVDLSDDAVPFIFSETPETPNRYRKTFVTSPTTHRRQGQPLPEGRHNSWNCSAFPKPVGGARRFQEDDKKECLPKSIMIFFARAG